MDEIIRISDNIDLVFSEYDEEESGLGWYFQDHAKNKTSQSFDDAYEAREEFDNKNIVWN